MKKTLSLFLSLVMLIGITTGLDLSVSAETTDYWIHDIILLDDGTTESTTIKASTTEAKKITTQRHTEAEKDTTEKTTEDKKTTQSVTDSDGWINKWYSKL